MGLFDKLKQATESVVRDAVQTASNKSVNVQFAKLPDTLDEFKALPQAQALQLLRSRAQLSPARQRQPQAAQQHRQARHRRQLGFDYRRGRHDYYRDHAHNADSASRRPQR